MILKKLRKNARRRFRRKQRARRNRRVNVDLFPKRGGFPKMLKFTHRYADVFSITSTTGVRAVQQFACNGLYDPDLTNAGHQPLYFDQLTPIYDHYCVIGSKIKCKLIPNSATAGVSFCATLFVNDDGTVTPTALSGIIEQDTGKSVITGGVSPNEVNLTSKWSARKYFGKNVLSNTDLQGTSTTNPNELSYYSLIIQAVDLASTVTCACIFEIEYIAIWKELKDIAQS